MRFSSLLIVAIIAVCFAVSVEAALPLPEGSTLTAVAPTATEFVLTTAEKPAPTVLPEDANIGFSLNAIMETARRLGHDEYFCFQRRASIQQWRYPVPNFGVDQDIVDTLNNIKQAELRLKLRAPAAGGKTWNYDCNGDYENRRGFEPAFR